jgi:hypothetical protein
MIRVELPHGLGLLTVSPAELLGQVTTCDTITFWLCDLKSICYKIDSSGSSRGKQAFNLCIQITRDFKSPLDFRKARESWPSGSSSAFQFSASQCGILSDLRVPAANSRWLPCEISKSLAFIVCCVTPLSPEFEALHFRKVEILCAWSLQQWWICRSVGDGTSGGHVVLFLASSDEALDAPGPLQQTRPRAF